MLAAACEAEATALPTALGGSALVRVGSFGQALRRRSEVQTLADQPCAEAHAEAGTETRRDRRERENQEAPGGLRSPHRYVQSNPQARVIGARLAAVIDEFLEEDPAVEGWLLEAGRAGREKLGSECEAVLVQRVADLLGVGSIAFGRRSKWRSGIVRAYVAARGDPETQFAGWLEEGAPTGVAREITACGVFPRVDTQAEADSEMYKHFAKVDCARNCKSAEENAALFGKEVERLIAAGYVREFRSWSALKREYRDVIVSRVAALIKEKDDGSVKVRIVIDMLRSMVNAFVKLSERIVLPRLMDVVTDLIDLATVCLQCGDGSEVVEQMVVDFVDAFHTIGVHPEEVPFQVFRLPGQGFGCYETVVFGGGGASLTWGRGGALLGRSGQALFDGSEARVEIYVDDPWTAFRGKPGRIRRLKCRLLLWWLVLGPEVSWAKVQHGVQVKWIGAMVSIERLTVVALSLPPHFASELAAEAVALLGLASAPLSRVRRLAGKAAWAGGFVPAVGAIIAPLWAAVGECKTGATQPRGQTWRGAREPVVPIARVRHALRWVAAFFGGRRGTLTREFDVQQHKARPQVTMDFDASPWGYGGVLIWQGRPWSYYGVLISEEDVARFGIKFGDPAFQALVENIAILIGVRQWLPIWKSERVIVRIRSDSQAALGAWRKERSSNQAVNMVVREMALDLAEGRYKIDVKEHLPGRCNGWADALSRLSQPGGAATVPSALEHAQRVHPAVRGAAWWRADGDPFAA